MAGSTNSLDSLSSPSPSPPPTTSKASGSASGPTSTTKKQKAAEPAAGLDSDSELSELTEEELDEKQKHKQKQKNADNNSPASRPSSTNKRGTGSNMRGGSRRGGRKKRSTLVPAPMWGWAVYNAEQGVDKGTDGEENEETAVTANVLAPNPLDVLTSAALDAESSRPTFSRRKLDSDETEEEEEKPADKVTDDVAIDVPDSVPGAVDDRRSSIASSRAPSQDSLASSRPSPPKELPPPPIATVYASTSRLPAAASTTEDEDDNTEVDEDDDHPRPTATKSRPKPNLRIDASAQLPSTNSSSHTSSPQMPPPSAASVKSPVTPSSSTTTKPKSSRGGRGRGRGRGRARTRGMKVHVPDPHIEVDKPTPADVIDDDPVAAPDVDIILPVPDVGDSMDIDVTEASLQKLPMSKSSPSKVADVESEDEPMEPDSAPPPTVTKTAVDANADASDKSDVEPEPEADIEADAEPEADAPSDASDGEDEKEDELDPDEGEGEDEKDDNDVDEVEAASDKEDEDKEVSDKEDEDKDPSDKEDDDRSEVELEEDMEEEEESDLQPAHRVEALEVLAIIELKFALLREKVYVEKMEELAWEEALIQSGDHPELIHIQNELSRRKNKRLELAERKCAFEVANITKRRRIDEDATWSTWKIQRDDLQIDMIAENNRKRRKLERERRATDRPPATRRIPPPPNPEFLPPAPSLRQVVDSFPFIQNKERTRTRLKYSSSSRKAGGKSQMNGIRNLRTVNGITLGVPVTSIGSASIVAYPELSTLSSAEAQGDLEALLSLSAFSGVSGGRRVGMGVGPPMGPAPLPMGMVGMGANNINNPNMNMGGGTGMAFNLPAPSMYDGPPHGPPGHGAHGHAHSASNPNPNRERERLGPGPGPSIGHGHHPARRIVSGPGSSSNASIGSSHPPPTSISGPLASYEHQFPGGPPPDSMPPSFGPGGRSGPRPGSSAGLRPGSAGGFNIHEREHRSIPSGPRSSLHHSQSHHPLSAPPTHANGVPLSDLERERDGDVIMSGPPRPPSTSSVSVHGIHGRQVSSSAYFGPPGLPSASGSGGNSTNQPPPSRRRSLSPVTAGPSVPGVGPNGVKGNGQWMGPGMGMGGFGAGYPGHGHGHGHRWEEEERERERIAHKDIRDGRDSRDIRDFERERERERERDHHIALQHRHVRPEGRPQSAGPGPGPPHLHSHPGQPSQAPHHHHHRPHHHHIVHHHHGPPGGPANSNSPVNSVHGPSLSPRMARDEPIPERERDHLNGPPRAPMTRRHLPLPTEIINLGSSSKGPSLGPSSNRMKDDIPHDYRERDVRRMSGGRPPSGPSSMIMDERDRERERDRDRDRSMSFALASSHGQQVNGSSTPSTASPRPSTWNAVDRDDPYRPDSMHHRMSSSASSPNHIRGPSSGAHGGPSSMTTISPPRSRALPPRPSSPAAMLSTSGHLGSSSSTPRTRSPPRHRERSPPLGPAAEVNQNHSHTKILRPLSPPMTSSFITGSLLTNNSNKPVIPVSSPAPGSIQSPFQSQVHGLEVIARNGTAPPHLSKISIGNSAIQSPSVTSSNPNNNGIVNPPKEMVGVDGHS
ncbi:hypothetical protein BDP27DRAFT_1309429 [Rhodocollybia butyracea]|uniref:Sds3-like-domain-containing protein n=1 Tax=Rhodocollybia butyracea TaxID=206335 RepID=A0A9P5UH13_9AGAR|nr:hypothetical protein BDP27DRAFT_1309429 [Rhodocollybia butyracea]